MNFKRGTLIQCSKCGHINEVTVELKIEERYPYENPLDELESIESDTKRIEAPEEINPIHTTVTHHKFPSQEKHKKRREG